MAGTADIVSLDLIGSGERLADTADPLMIAVRTKYSCGDLRG